VWWDRRPNSHESERYLSCEFQTKMKFTIEKGESFIFSCAFNKDQMYAVSIVLR